MIHKKIMMKKFLLLIVLLLIGFGVLQYRAGIAYNQPSRNYGTSVDKPVVKIGVIMPITGNLSEVGQSSNVAVDKVREETKDSPINFKFIVEDNAHDLKKSAIIASKLVDLDKASVVVSLFTGPATAVTSVTTPKNVLHICIANDCNIASGPLNFVNWQQMSVAAQKMVELLKSKNVRKIVIFTVEDAGNALISKHIRERFADNDIVFEEFRFNPTERNFTMIVEKAARIDNADMWFLNTISPGTELIRKLMIEKKIEIPVTTIQTFRNVEDKRLIKGFDYVDAAEIDNNFKSYIKDKTGSENVTIAAYTYDTLKMIVKLNEDFYKREERLPTPEEMAQELLAMKDYYGAVGHIEIAPNRVMYSDTVITTVK